MLRKLVSLLVIGVFAFPSLGFSSAPKVKVGKPIDFTAELSLKQVKVVNEPQGESQRWRTVEEEIEGSVVSSTWSAIAGAQVRMHNFTNFELVPSPEGGLYIQGTTHSNIEIISSDGTLSLVGSGKIEGVIPFGATVEMFWNSTGGTGTLTDAHAWGKFTSNVSWLSPYNHGQWSGNYQEQ